MFEIWGIEGVAFVDGAEAVAWIEDVDQGRVRGELPELAILDIRLPEVSGPEVGSRLRRSTVLKDIAIVLITAYRLSPEEEEQVIAQAQADRLMYKPLPGMVELRAAMDEVIARHKRRTTEVDSVPAPPAVAAPKKPEASAKPAAEPPSPGDGATPVPATPRPAKPAPKKPDVSSEADTSSES